jgi:uracil-DNA glycosylase
MDTKRKFMPVEKIALSTHNDRIITCRLCPRLVDYREQVAREKRRAFRDEIYWGRPLPGWGDPQARILIVGLAPAAHGANRTGRMFTGDRSGDFLYGALYRAGFANQPVKRALDDGLELSNVYITKRLRAARRLRISRPLLSWRIACHTCRLNWIYYQSLLSCWRLARRVLSLFASIDC